MRALEIAQIMALICALDPVANFLHGRVFPNPVSDQALGVFPPELPVFGENGFIKFFNRLTFELHNDAGRS